MYPSAVADILSISAPAHLGYIYDPQGPWREVVMAFLAHGLAQGERVTYLYDQGSAQAHQNALDRRGVDVKAALDQGRLTIKEARRFYHAAGQAQPDDLLERIGGSLRDARDQGFGRLRVVAEMGWADGESAKELELLGEYEQRLNSEVFPRFPLNALCLYDRRRFNPLWQDMVCRSHPLLISPAGLIQPEAMATD